MLAVAVHKLITPLFWKLWDPVADNLRAIRLCIYYLLNLFNFLEKGFENNNNKNINT